MRLSHPGIRIIFIVAHVPHEAANAEADPFWRATSHALPARYRSWTTIFSSASIGSFAADTESPNGQCLHEWISQHDIWLPQTFETCHHGPSDTWFHSTGKGARIDFVGFSPDIPTSKVESFVDQSIDLSTKRLDHQCVCVQFPVTVHLVDETQRFHSVAPITTTEGAGSRDVPWNVDVHTHAAILQRHLRTLPCQRAHKLPRKTHMSTHTWHLGQIKAWQCRRSRQIHQHQQQSLLRAVFRAWRKPDVEQ